LSLAPRQVKGGTDRAFVPANSFGECRELAYAAGVSLLEPGVELVRSSSVQEREEGLHDFPGGRDQGTVLQECVHVGRFARRDLVEGTEQEPRNVAWRGVHRRGQRVSRRLLRLVGPRVAGAGAPAPEQPVEARLASPVALRLDLAQQLLPVLFARIPPLTQI